MIITLHGLSTMHSNVKTDIRIAGEAGFEAIEITENKLLRYLDVGLKAKDLVPLLKKYSVSPVCINALKNIERIESGEKKDLLSEAEILCKAANDLGCPVIQLVPFCGLEGRPFPEILKLTAQNISEIADIGKVYGIKFQLEPIAWSPINSLSKSLKVIDIVARDNVGMVIDFWHLWAGEETTPEDVSKLDKSLIYGVHFGDGKRRKKNTEWNEEGLRGFLAGEGDIPINEWIKAIKATGFDGVYSSELYSPKHWEWDLFEIAVETRKCMEEYIK